MNKDERTTRKQEIEDLGKNKYFMKLSIRENW